MRLGVQHTTKPAKIKKVLLLRNTMTGIAPV